MNTRVPKVRRRKRILVGCAAAAMLALSGCRATADLVSYDLPAQSARYTFETTTNGATTVWNYTSAKPAKNDAPEHNPCLGTVLGDNMAACRPEPLIFLRYDLDLAVDNTAKAGDTHEIKITGYYQERLGTLPKVTSLKTEVSFDGGTTWRHTSVEKDGKNTFTTEIKHPKREQAAKGVALRINATDSEGNTVKQTLPTAYKLR
ncbi:hypothetical protein [Streptomyces sp. NPDC059949]|uniref:hypothetical protein n=1 Tax=Streptomyces sp. NPDC059949 TaxID=3347013 RepID=UPI00365A05E8